MGINPTSVPPARAHKPPGEQPGGKPPSMERPPGGKKLPRCDGPLGGWAEGMPRLSTALTRMLQSLLGLFEGSKGGRDIIWNRDCHSFD